MYHPSIFRFLFSATLFFNLNLGSALNTQGDSLINALKNIKVDSLKVDILNQLSYNHFSTNPDTAIYFGEKAKSLAKKINYSNGLAYANKNIGLGHYVSGDYFSVLSYWEESLEAFQKANDKIGESNLLLNIGAVYFAFGDDAIALEYYLKSLKAAEDIDNNFRIYSALVNIGTLYQNKAATYDQALEYYRKSLEYLPFIEDQRSIDNLYTNLGLLFFKKENYDSS
ncbi:MAG: tetratricopeptide repeat protein, partial [Nitrososphaeraceae archaeon]|nr:tetratricopeptide repeat protein [Nitrososphaeraceae archaeon]